jgi:hypothetical protein
LKRQIPQAGHTVFKFLVRGKHRTDGASRPRRLSALLIWIALSQGWENWAMANTGNVRPKSKSDVDKNPPDFGGSAYDKDDQKSRNALAKLFPEEASLDQTSHH